MYPTTPALTIKVGLHIHAYYMYVHCCLTHATVFLLASSLMGELCLVSGFSMAEKEKIDMTCCSVIVMKKNYVAEDTSSGLRFPAYSLPYFFQ
jgi:hypothetical protein